jgi:hypothetical protein
MTFVPGYSFRYEMLKKVKLKPFLFFDYFIYLNIYLLEQNSKQKILLNYFCFAIKSIKN